MNSLKTGVVVVVLLGVLYGVYRVLNMPDHQDSQFMANLGLTPQMTEPPKIETGVPFNFPENDDGALAPEPKRFLNEPGLPDQWAGSDGNEPPPLPKTETPAPGDGMPFPPRDDYRDSVPGAGELPKNSPRDTPRNYGTVDLSEAWRDARALVDTGDLREALDVLSFYYNNPGLSAQQRSQLQAWLDPLAGKVIYSAEHHLEEPYTVQRGDTLEGIAKRYNVPAQLIYNINQDALSQHDTLFPGTKLKVLRGPFEATVDLENNRLTLFVDGLYAGYFDISVGGSRTPQTGPYTVKRKLHPDDQENPVGQWLVDLGSEVSIHGTPASQESKYQCIVLNPNDAADVTSILSEGSKIHIRR